MAALGGDLPGRAVMLQASASFFAYEPILRALQVNQSMPLAQYIAAARLKSIAKEPLKPNEGSVWKGLADLRTSLFGRSDNEG